MASQRFGLLAKTPDRERLSDLFGKCVCTDAERRGERREVVLLLLES
jgi:hypothetical protein